MRPALVGVVLVAGVLVRPAGFPAETAGGASTGPALRVTASYPCAGMTGLLTDPVCIRFNVPIDPSTVTGDTVRVKTGTATVAGAAIAGFDADGDGDPRSVIWIPALPLQPGGAWKLEVTRGIASLKGRNLDDPFSATFTTSPAKDDSEFQPLAEGQKLARVPRLGPKPKVTFTFPQGGLGSVYTDNVLVRFNKAMRAESLLGGTFNVFQGDTPVPGSIAFPEEGEGREVEFVPDHPLFRDTSFRFVVTRDASTSKGRYLREEYAAGFGTSPFKGGVKPILAEDFDDVAEELPVGRAFHTATVLPSGDVLVAGGQSYGGSPLDSCFIWRTSSGTFEAAAPLAVARRKHAAVALTSGSVMVVGGFGPTGATLNSVEIYNPSSNSWTSAAPLATGRANHTATVLGTARVLVAGGFTGDSSSLAYAQGAELYNPLTASWSATTGAPQGVRGGHTAMLLPDGRVLLSGGSPAGTLLDELYVPTTGLFEATNPPQVERIFHAACITRTGTVLLAGGGPGLAEQFIPSTNSYLPAGSCPAVGLQTSTSGSWPTLSLLPTGGRIALVGGLVFGGGFGGSDLILDQVQLWDPAGGGGTGAFYPMFFDLKVPRAAHTTTRLQSGAFLIVGGFGSDGLSNEQAVTIFRPTQ